MSETTIRPANLADAARLRDGRAGAVVAFSVSAPGGVVAAVARAQWGVGA